MGPGAHHIENMHAFQHCKYSNASTGGGTEGGREGGREGGEGAEGKAGTTPDPVQYLVRTPGPGFMA